MRFYATRRVQSTEKVLGQNFSSKTSLGSHVVREKCPLGCLTSWKLNCYRTAAATKRTKNAVASPAKRAYYIAPRDAVLSVGYSCVIILIIAATDRPSTMIKA